MSQEQPPRSPADVDLRILTSATAEEVAAITAVVQATLEELAEGLAAHAGEGPNGWQRSQHPLRGTLRPGPGAWRSSSY